ncbi:MAG: universal stress protein [Nitrospiraceae bacterium]|nr:universal stress protein [Nitrospiraceae bacterium]
MVRKILVAFDDSPESREAFDYALEMGTACKPGPSILILSVVQPPESLYFVEISNAVAEATSHYAQAQKELEEKARAKNLEVASEIQVGHPASEIVKTAKDKNCDMIVMGHQGRSMIGGLLLGSVSKKVASEAHCSVTIIK